jgi:hypothetical protein
MAAISSLTSFSAWCVSSGERRRRRRRRRRKNSRWRRRRRRRRRRWRSSVVRERVSRSKREKTNESPSTT